MEIGSGFRGSKVEALSPPHSTFPAVGGIGCSMFLFLQGIHFSSAGATNPVVTNISLEVP
jgi:hypothetical protein